MFGLGSTEIIVIAVILLLLFDSKKIVEFAGGLGKTKKELKNIKKEFDKNTKE